VAAKGRRLGLGSELLGLETTKAEGVEAEKGAGVIEGLLAHRALCQLVGCVQGEGKKNKEKDEEGERYHKDGENEGSYWERCPSGQ